MPARAMMVAMSVTVILMGVIPVIVVAVTMFVTVGAVPMAFVAMRTVPMIVVAVMIRVVVPAVRLFFRTAAWHPASLICPLQGQQPGSFHLWLSM
jgi:hypothetical protein